MHCWGDGSTGLFGLPSSDIYVKPVPVKISVKVRSIACGEQHALFLTEDGTVLSSGNNLLGQLGRQRNRQSNLPEKVEGLEDVVAIACGRAHSVVVLASGQMFSWGAGMEGQLGIKTQEPCNAPRPRSIPMPSEIYVVQVSCGYTHSVALTSGGEVFSWGLNIFGQLGLGKAVDLRPVPSLVRSLTGAPVTQVAASGYHTLFLTLPGTVYCCGANHHGQLGLNRVDENGRFNICAIPALRPLGVSFISCGEEHSAVLTKDGRVFTFGQGKRGQLGHNSRDKELLPKLVERIEGRASQIACGRHHTLVLGSSGELWAFGAGERGQMGSGGSVNLQRPTTVQLPWAYGSAATPDDLKITAAWNSNFIYTAMESSCPERLVGRLDEAKLEKWVSMKTGDAKSKREISVMFSSCASLVASFTKVSESPSALTAGTLTVNMDAARLIFDRLLSVPWIKELVDLEPIVMDLLTKSGPLLKSPEIFLLLPLCTQMHDEDNIMNLTLPLSIALHQLKEANLKLLKDWCLAMSLPVMTRHILLWKNTLRSLLTNRQHGYHTIGVKMLLHALKRLYRANRKCQDLPICLFYVDEIAENVDLKQDVQMWRHWPIKEDDDNTPAIFCRFPFAFNLKCKIDVFNYSTSVEKTTHAIHGISEAFPELFPAGGVPGVPKHQSPPLFELKLRRSHLLEDTFRQMSVVDHQTFRGELMVRFVEDKKKEVKDKDFFLHAFEQLLAPESEMFMYNDRKTLIWFPSQPKLGNKDYFLFGVLCGMALYNHHIVHLPFPLALFKKLVNVKPSLDDMKEFDPILGGSLNYVLVEYEEDDVVNLDMTYSVFWDDKKVELDPQKPGKRVTSSNKKQFVDTYVNYAFNQSVERVFEEFKRGFFKVCDRDVVDFFQPEELKGVMVGMDDYDWKLLRKNTGYDGEYHHKHPNILAFWEAFEELTEDQKEGFLLFVTGCGRVPILGMDKIKMTIAVLTNSTEHHFPESLACNSLLLLPIYPSMEILQARLLESINHNRGFWKE